MKRFAIALRWSQTESETILIEAPDKDEAMRFAYKRFCGAYGAHHADFICEIPETVHRCDFL